MVGMDEMKNSIQLDRFLALGLEVKITAQRDFFGLAEVKCRYLIEADVEKLCL